VNRDFILRFAGCHNKAYDDDADDADDDDDDDGNCCTTTQFCVDVQCTSRLANQFRKFDSLTKAVYGQNRGHP